MQSLAGPCTPPEDDSDDIEAVFGITEEEEEESDEYEEVVKKEEEEEEEWSLNLELSKDTKQRRKRRVSSTSTPGDKHALRIIEEETHKEAINHRVMESISEKPVSTATTTTREEAPVQVQPPDITTTREEAPVQEEIAEAGLLPPEVLERREEGLVLVVVQEVG